jgi:hypothetical protein
MMVMPMMIVVAVVAMLFAALQRMLGLKSSASEINSYHRGASIAGKNCTRLDGGSNIGRSDTNEGKSNNATKHSELRECVSWPWS